MAENIIFAAPAGFIPREPAGDDNTFQAMATFKVMPNNQLQLVDIEGYEVGQPRGAVGRAPGNMARARRVQPLPAGAPGAAPPGAMPAVGAPSAASPNFASSLMQRFRAATGRR
jgi:hypothetical protein